ncbi:MAG: hypothetical protein IK016_01330 [Lachnospiraceae bacterium]|nr:hypothetical protein [Lachnospiraceae bacterium]
MILKGLLLLWQLLILPLLCGGLFFPFLPEKKKTLPVLFVAGLLQQFALFEAVAIPCVLTERIGIFSTCSNIFAVLFHLCAAAGAYCYVREIRGGWQPELPKKPDVLTAAFCVLYAGLLLFRLYMAFTRATFDGDDSYYVAHAVSAAQVGSMYRVDAYTGIVGVIDIRHALAVLPMWEAHTARLSMLHPTVLVHSLLPLFLIPLTDLLWYLCGSSLLREKRKALPLFLSLMALFQMFGSVSIYTTERFALTRTWQGKSLMANAVVPVILWLFCWLFESAAAQETREGRRGLAPYLLLALANLFAGVCTSMGIVLAGGLTMLASLFYALYRRAPRQLLYLACTVLVNAGYLMVYLGKG